MTVVIASAPNGAYKQRGEHPKLPLTLKEIVKTAIAVQKAGAAMLHLHIRETDGSHSLDPTIYLKTLEAIQTELGDQLLLQITSEAGGKYSASEQIAAVKEVKPDAVSVALKEVIRSPDDMPKAQAFFNWLAEHQVLPQYILYSDADVNLYKRLRQQYIMPTHPHSVLFVLGRYHNSQQSNPEELQPFLNAWDKDSSANWMVCAFGSSEQDCLLSAAKQSGHVRIGFENSLLTKNGLVADSNEAQVFDLVQTLRLNGLTPANAQQAKTLLS